MKVIALVNKKGGVGKTTIASNLGQGLAILGKRVLLIDNDAQHNLSTSVGLSVRDCDSTLFDVMKTTSRNLEKIVAASIYQSFMDGLDIIPGSIGLDTVNPQQTLLKEVLATEAVRKWNYDFVIIDNAPAMNERTRCAVFCSDYFLLPVQLRQFAIDGLTELFRFLTVEYGIKSEQIYIIRNMYRQGRIFDAASKALEMCYPDNIVEVVIPDDISFENLVCSNKTMFFSKTKSRGTLCFQHLICEIFGLDEQKMLDVFKNALCDYKTAIAKKNLKRANIINLSLEGGN